MNNDIINAILSKEYNKAQELITESMNEKIGMLLEEKLQEYAPTLFESLPPDNKPKTSRVLPPLQETETEG